MVNDKKEIFVWRKYNIKKHYTPPVVSEIISVLHFG